MAFPADLGNTLFTALGGIAGYAFREYENRITPFLQVNKIEGDSMRLEDRVNIPEDISSRLKDSCFIGSLGPSARLGDAFSVWDRAEDMNLFWPGCDKHLARFLNAHDQKDAIDDLTKLFEFKLIDESLSTLLRQNHIIIPSIPNEGAEEIEICFDKETALINFPEGVRSFGGTMGLDNPMIRSRCSAFLRLVSHLEIRALKDLFRQYQEIMKKEYYVANDVLEPLNQITNSNSRWILRCYVANINSTPLVISKKLYISIIDRKSIKYRLPAYLVAIEGAKDGKGELRDLGTPIVLESGSSTWFAAVTEQAQCEMQTRSGLIGTAIRECFDRGQASCYIELTIRRVGLFGNQQFRSPSVSFRQDVEKKTL